MQADAVVMWIVTFTVLCFALVRNLRGDVLVPLTERSEGGTEMPDEEEQQPETDLVPVKHRHLPSLALTVAATAALRLGLLVALHR